MSTLLTKIDYKKKNNFPSSLHITGSVLISVIVTSLRV